MIFVALLLMFNLVSMSLLLKSRFIHHISCSRFAGSFTLCC